MTATPGMTREDALAEAERRWGAGARAVDVGSRWSPETMRKHPHRDEVKRPCFLVGSINRNMGWGETYEAAFEDATRRESGREKGER